MKPSVLRVCSAFLLMAIAIAVSLGMMAAAVGEEKQDEQSPDCVWIHLPLRTSPGRQIRLYSSNGLPAGVLQADENGCAVTGPLPAGSYYAVTEDCCCVFSLSETAQVLPLGTCGRFDGQALHLTGENMGSITVTARAEGEDWLEYTLSDGSGHSYQMLRQRPVGVVSCVFSAVPYGSYRLEENGIFQCNVILSGENPNITVSLP